jgi:hypothetical protein
MPSPILPQLFASVVLIVSKAQPLQRKFQEWQLSVLVQTSKERKIKENFANFRA